MESPPLLKLDLLLDRCLGVSHVLVGLLSIEILRLEATVDLETDKVSWPANGLKAEDLHAYPVAETGKYIQGMHRLYSQFPP